MTNAASSTIHRVSMNSDRGSGAILCDISFSQAINDKWFDVSSYAEKAVPVTAKGGRGAAWFVEGAFGDGVLRHYRRGGLVAKLSERDYFWKDEASTRSFHEFHFLHVLRAKNLPVPVPIAACYTKKGLLYRASLLMQRIPGVKSFQDAVHQKTESAPWEKIGRAIAVFHRHGAQHADLNAQNILIDNNEIVWLIDWDKAQFQNASGRWCHENLDRLQRSLLKYRGSLDVAMIESGMQRLRAAHDKDIEA
jgi:3-deoxy-D-manno-octulosonic acid kinase